MSNKDHNESRDSSMTQAFTELNWDITPDRDLWPEITAKLDSREQHTASVHSISVATKRLAWQPYAIAASLLLAVGSLFFSSMLYQQSQDLKRYQSDLASYQQAQLLLIEQQHQMVRAQFNLLLSSSDSNINTEFVSVAQELMNNVDNASAEIKKAMLAQPNNPDYASMLVRTYQQEIKLLNSVKAMGNDSNKIEPTTTKQDDKISI